MNQSQNIQITTFLDKYKKVFKMILIKDLKMNLSDSNYSKNNNFGYELAGRLEDKLGHSVKMTGIDGSLSNTIFTNSPGICYYLLEGVTLDDLKGVLQPEEYVLACQIDRSLVIDCNPCLNVKGDKFKLNESIKTKEFQKVSSQSKLELNLGEDSSKETLNKRESFIDFRDGLSCPKDIYRFNGDNSDATTELLVPIPSNEKLTPEEENCLRAKLRKILQEIHRGSHIQKVTPFEDEENKRMKYKPG